MNMSAWIQQILDDPMRRALPVMTFPGLALTGGRVLDVVTDPSAQLACIQELNKVFPCIGAQTIMDLSVEAEAFGCPVKFCDHEVPTVTSPIINEPEDVAKVIVPKAGDKRMSVYLEVARRAAQEKPDFPIFGGMIGPYSLAVRLRDMTTIMIDLMLQPDMIHSILEMNTAFLIEYAQAFKAAGAHGILMAEPAAGLLAAPHCEEFSSQYVKRIVQAVQDESFIVILHNCGRTKDLVSSMLGTGAKGFHFGNAVDMMDILPQIPADVPAMGNIDPASVIKNGTAEDVYLATATLLKRTADYPNFVLSSGCDIPPGAPLANLEAFFAALKDFNEKKQPACAK